MKKEGKEPSTDREFIDYRFNELAKQVDEIKGIMRGFAFAKQSALDEVDRKVEKLAQEIRDKYVTKESQRPWHSISIGIAVAVGTAIVIGILKMMGTTI